MIHLYSKIFALLSIVQCADEWISYSPTLQYMYAKECRTYDDSQKHCIAQGGELASGHLQAQRDFIVNTVYDGTNPTGSCTSWLGTFMGAKTNQIDTIYWSDGTTTPFASIEWDTSENEPDNLSSHLGIGFKLSSGLFHTVHLGDENAQICQRTITTTAPTTSTPTVATTLEPTTTTTTTTTTTAAPTTTAPTATTTLEPVTTTSTIAPTTTAPTATTTVEPTTTTPTTTTTAPTTTTAATTVEPTTTATITDTTLTADTDAITTTVFNPMTTLITTSSSLTTSQTTTSAYSTTATPSTDTTTSETTIERVDDTQYETSNDNDTLDQDTATAVKSFFGNNIYLEIVIAVFALILLVICVYFTVVALMFKYGKRRKPDTDISTEQDPVNSGSPLQAQMTDNSFFAGLPQNKLHMVPSKSFQSVTTVHSRKQTETEMERRESEENVEIQIQTHQRPITLSVDIIPFEELPPPESLPPPNTFVVPQTLPVQMDAYNSNHQYDTVQNTYKNGDNNIEYVDNDPEENSNTETDYTDPNLIEVADEEDDDVESTSTDPSVQVSDEEGSPEIVTQVVEMEENRKRALI